MMATAREGWRRVKGIPIGPVLYALRRATLFDQSLPVWKIGRTCNLGRRLREFPDVMTPVFVRDVEAHESAIDLEAELHAQCPFPRAGGGRELYRCAEGELEGWLNGKA